MFKVFEIKNKNRRGNHKKIEPIPLEILPITRPDERTVPYYTVVPEQARKYEPYQLLDWQLRGLFRLAADALWSSGGKLPNLDHTVALRIGVPTDVWSNGKQELIKAGLLVLVSNGEEIMQPELREQYIQFLDAHST